jgi:hypothetical protein
MTQLREYIQRRVLHDMDKRQKGQSTKGVGS